ncbi:probable intraflagellar transport protein 122 homolog [Coccomyxa sp. Obi]|nr:probable intraflagellar transport protein 122 homolog [Coccomyxa sp. Obi]
MQHVGKYSNAAMVMLGGAVPIMWIWICTSMFTFECLPLIEIFLEEGLSDDEAARILQQASNNTGMSLRDKYGSGQFGGRKEDNQVENHQEEVLEPVIIGRAGLESIGTKNILVQRWPAACLPARYFILMDPDMSLSMSAMGPVESDELDITWLGVV